MADYKAAKVAQDAMDRFLRTTVSIAQRMEWIEPKDAKDYEKAVRIAIFKIKDGADLADKLESLTAKKTTKKKIVTKKKATK